MKFLQLAKMLSILLTLSVTVACSSTSEDADASETVAETSESGIDATNRRAREQEAARAARAQAAADRIKNAALATTVFYFDFDIAEFRAADREVLAFHAADLAANPRKRIRLEGHADERGTREYNLALGERRGTAVLNYLIVNGASRNQIESVSYGEERPAQRGQGESAMQQNRRVEIVAQ